MQKIETIKGLDYKSCKVNTDFKSGKEERRERRKQQRKNKKR